MHPKSYISLDGADHLLTRKEDSTYVGHMIASWAVRYVSLEVSKDGLETNHQVVVRNEQQNGFFSEIMAKKHYLVADEPKDIGGTDLGSTPYDLLVSALGTCTAITIRMYAKHKGIDLQEVKVHLTREKRHATDATDTENPNSLMEFIDLELEVAGNLTEEEKAGILRIAHKCPVHKTLVNGLQINASMK